MSLQSNIEKINNIYQILTSIYRATLKNVAADTEGPLLTLIERHGSEAAFNYLAALQARYEGIDVKAYIENTDVTFLIVSYKGETELVSIEKFLDPSRRVTDGSSGQATEIDFADYFEEKDISDIDGVFIPAGIEYYCFSMPDFIQDEDYDLIDVVLNSAEF